MDTQKNSFPLVVKNMLVVNEVDSSFELFSKTKLCCGVVVEISIDKTTFFLVSHEALYSVKNSVIREKFVYYLPTQVLCNMYGSPISPLKSVAPTPSMERDVVYEEMTATILEKHTELLTESKNLSLVVAVKDSDILVLQGSSLYQLAIPASDHSFSIGQLVSWDKNTHRLAGVSTGGESDKYHKWERPSSPTVLL